MLADACVRAELQQILVNEMASATVPLIHFVQEFIFEREYTTAKMSSESNVTFDRAHVFFHAGNTMDLEIVEFLTNDIASEVVKCAVQSRRGRKSTQR